VAPNRPFGAIGGSLGPIRARRPESGSKVSIWSHLSLPGPDPGQETRKWLQTVHLEPSVAPWARSGPGDPKVAPNRPFGAICRSLGPIRAREPESGSTKCSGTHLWLSGLEPGLSNAGLFHTRLLQATHRPHDGRQMQATRLQATHASHDCRPYAGHTQATRLNTGYTLSKIPPPPFTMCSPARCSDV
jgi:hypothetical protein